MHGSERQSLTEEEREEEPGAPLVHLLARPLEQLRALAAWKRKEVWRSQFSC